MKSVLFVFLLAIFLNLVLVPTIGSFILMWIFPIVFDCFAKGFVFLAFTSFVVNGGFKFKIN